MEYDHEMVWQLYYSYRVAGYDTPVSKLYEKCVKETQEFLEQQNKSKKKEKAK